MEKEELKSGTCRARIVSELNNHVVVSIVYAAASVARSVENEVQSRVGSLMRTDVHNAVQGYPWKFKN